MPCVALGDHVLPFSVYVQFSNHTQLKTDQTHSNASPSAQAALQAAQALVGTGGDTGKETVSFRTNNFIIFYFTKGKQF